MRIIKIFYILIISLFLNYNSLSLALNVPNNSRDLVENLFINISGRDKFYEYQLNLGTNSFNKTKESKTVIHTKEGRDVINKSDEFVKAEARLKAKSHKLERLLNKFSKDELIAISELSTKSIIGNCQANSVHPIKLIKDVSSIDNKKKLMAQDLVLFDKQLKYAVLSSPYKHKGSGVIVDISKKEVIFPFCGNIVKELVLSPNGFFVAYSIGKVKEFSGKTLVIYDMQKRRIILKKEIGEYITSITWSPTSDHIALLSKKTRFLSLNPLDILGFISGHPTEYSKFSLRIFNFQKEVKQINNFVTGIKNASSTILWYK